MAPKVVITAQLPPSTPPPHREGQGAHSCPHHLRNTFATILINTWLYLGVEAPKEATTPRGIATDEPTSATILRRHPH